MQWKELDSCQKLQQWGCLFAPFSNDLVLFAKADHVNYSTIQDVLGSFCARSYQSISASKSRVYFSPNVDVDTRESLCDILGFHSTPTLGKYLGFPIKHCGANNEDLNFVLIGLSKNWLVGKPTFFPWQVGLFSSKLPLLLYLHMSCNARLSWRSCLITLIGSIETFCAG